MKKITLFLLGAGLSAFVSQGQQPMITLESELQRLSDFGSLPAFVSGTEAQVSTYDRTGGNNDGFNGTYSFVRRNADSSLVMLDVDGPGEINRFATPTPTTDTLDFYFDRNTRPGLSISYIDLFTGYRYPFIKPLCDSGAGGCFSYFPILFQRHCMIVSRGRHLQFHQIQYRVFPAGTRVETYSGAAAAAARVKLGLLGSGWGESYSSRLSRLAADAHRMTSSIMLRPGDSAVVSEIKGGGRITGLMIGGATAMAGANVLADSAANIWIRMTWDGESKPAIEVPVADFFGYVGGKPSMAGLLLGGVLSGGDSAAAYCYLPMPFDRSARIELIYKGAGDSIRVTATVISNGRPRNKALEGKLYAHYQSNNLGPDDPYHVFLQTTGKGHYIGTILYAQGLHRPGTIFFEGDDSLATDGVMRIHGTGSEDYFSGGWYALKGRWDTARSFALSGCLLYSWDRAVTGGYRFYDLDKVPFSHAIWMGIEHGPEPTNRVAAHYRSIAFYYHE
jgi:Protein of unknown function (DUF2961)